LALFDLLFRENISKTDREKLKQAAFSAETDQLFRRKLTTCSGETDQCRSEATLGLINLNHTGQFESRGK
jgi:hypothetical protein